MDTEQHILCLAARLRRNSGDERQLVELLRGPLDWERLWAQGNLHEVGPLLATSLRQLQGQISIPAGWMERAQRRVYATLLKNSAFADTMLEVLAAFRDAGVEALPIKGIVLAETLYGSLALRPTADLDVLVRPEDLPAARAALRSHGFTHRAKQLFAEAHHPYHDPQYFRQTNGSQVCLELHWALWATRFFQMGSEALWERAVPARLHGAQVRILSPEDTLLHLAIHRSRSALRLRFVCDVAELLRSHSSTLDWDAMLVRARAAGARTTLFFTLMLAQDLLEAPLPPEILPRLGVSRIKQRLLGHTCGVAALFRPAAPDDTSQQPSLLLRIFEQDGIGHIVSALGYSAIRTGQKHLYNYRRDRQ